MRNLVRKTREAQGIIQTELAAKAIVGPSTLNRIERWGMPCTRETASRLADALGVEIGELFPDFAKSKSAGAGRR